MAVLSALVMAALTTGTAQRADAVLEIFQMHLRRPRLVHDQDLSDVIPEPGISPPTLTLDISFRRSANLIFLTPFSTCTVPSAKAFLEDKFSLSLL